MKFPYQCVAQCSQSPDQDFLIAALGSSLHVFSLKDGAHLDSWPPNDIILNSKGLECPPIANARGHEHSNDNDSSARKRRRKSSEGSDSSSAEILLDQNSSIGNSVSPCPPIVKLTATHDSRYIVALTGEDKAIRVIKLDHQGCLKQYSKRILPKRPCAVTISRDDRTIFCADKFGDVFALPLLGTTKPSSDSPNGSSVETVKVPQDSSPPPFMPSASSKTVHTKKNREALRQQELMIQRKKDGGMQQQMKTNAKSSPDFEAKLVLGHVSLLTDVLYASLETPANKIRDYILTADRDEHIRVSRAPPQSHIIEAYCLGHAQFISKLSLIPSHPRLLLSGGGDEDLILWDWPSGILKQRLSLRSCLENAPQPLTLDPHWAWSNEDWKAKVQEYPPAVLAICTKQNLDTSNKFLPTSTIIVTLEGIPALFTFNIDLQGTVSFTASFPTPSNILDVTFLNNSGRALCVLDTFHQPFSTTVVSHSQGQDIHNHYAAATIIDLTSTSGMKPSGTEVQLLKNMQVQYEQSNEIDLGNPNAGQSLSDNLYGLQALRKKAS